MKAVARMFFRAYSVKGTPAVFSTMYPAIVGPRF
jgi:hypothetical protein